MRNERGAGRKPQITSEQLNEIQLRIESGESVSKLAKEYGVSRQALYSRIRLREAAEPIRLDYLVDGVCTTQIFVNLNNREVEIKNMTNRLSAYAFGIMSSPSWEEFTFFLEHLYLRGIGAVEDVSWGRGKIWIDEDRRSFSLADVMAVAPGYLRLGNEENTPDFFSKKIFTISKKALLYCRTDTDGFQCKALSKDRKWFIKAQDIIAGVSMDDWVVEIIASELCKQLEIPCAEQYPCEVVYGEQKYKGVYSKNFELDGYEFVSFERLIEQLGLSTYDKDFVRLDAMGKLEWCAEKLSIAGGIDYKVCLKYMIDLALIDCLVGNVDRHTRNYGLFFDPIKNVYSIPLMFDNGMGLFEHDPYRDRYTSFESAMDNVYVSPYGEDPFDMIRLLDEKYDLKKMYPNLSEIKYTGFANGELKPLAREYVERMRRVVDELWVSYG